LIDNVACRIYISNWQNLATNLNKAVNNRNKNNYDISRFSG